MSRRLRGTLDHLGLEPLFRLVAASGVRGVLEIRHPKGTVRLRVGEGLAAPEAPGSLEILAAAAADGRGEFRLEVGAAGGPGEGAVPLDALLARAREAAPEGATAPGPAGAPVHHLPARPPEDPLTELVDDLQAVAPEELSLLPVGVVASDPRPWRGSTPARWRRRGWELRLYGVPDEVPVERLAAVVVHHGLSVTRVGREDAWLDLVRRARAPDPPRPAVWVGPLGDPRWVQRLAEAGASYLLPPPPAASGEPLERFLATLEVVLEDLLASALRAEAEPGALTQVLDALLLEAPVEEALGAVLQVAARRLRRAAVVEVTPTAFRFRAAVGYRPDPERAALPRGTALLERVVRGAAEVVGIAAEEPGAAPVASALGVSALAEQTCLLPMLDRGRVAGILVGDHEGEPLPPVEELAGLVRRMGRLLAR